MATNLFMLGMAYQAGLIPLAAASIEHAIELNGVAVQQNQQAFRYGRRYVHAPQAVMDLAVAPPKSFNEERAAMLLYLEEQYSKAEREAYFYLLERCTHLDDGGPAAAGHPHWRAHRLPGCGLCHGLRRLRA